MEEWDAMDKKEERERKPVKEMSNVIWDLLKRMKMVWIGLPRMGW